MILTRDTVNIWANEDSLRRASETGYFLMASNEPLRIGFPIKLLSENGDLVARGAVVRTVSKETFDAWFHTVSPEYNTAAPGFDYYYEVHFD